jgi:hypothetical protein
MKAMKDSDVQPIRHVTKHFGNARPSNDIFVLVISDSIPFLALISIPEPMLYAMPDSKQPGPYESMKIEFMVLYDFGAMSARLLEKQTVMTFHDKLGSGPKMSS